MIVKEWINIEPFKGKRGAFWGSKKVAQYNLDWIFIKSFDSVSFTGKSLWISKSLICRCCKWERKQTWWFMFRYCE